MSNLVVVTASLDPIKTNKYVESWWETADNKDLEINQPIGIFGVVPAFLAGIKSTMEFDLLAGRDPKDTIIACFHDDLKIYEQGWDTKVKQLFDSNPKCGLAGFGGAYGIGTDDIYQAPYSPFQLARQNFISNLKDAENHGSRELEMKRVACFDGFSNIGYAKDMLRWYEFFYRNGIKHHSFDSWLGALAYSEGKEAWYLPISCHHHGGVTATAPAYNEWANKVIKGGDKGFWEDSHRAFFEWGKGILPIRIA